MNTTLKLGQTLRDAISGYEGIAVNRTHFMNGNVQYNLQQPAKDGVLPDTISFDHHTLDVVDDGVSARATESTFESPIKLGNTVEDIVTGTRGIAVLKTYYMNGCAAFLVESKLASQTQAGQVVAQDWADQTRLKVVDAGIAEQIVQPPKASNGMSPGGPVMRGIPRG